MLGDSNRLVTHQVWGNPSITLKAASAEMEHITLYVYLSITVSNSPKNTVFRGGYRPTNPLENISSPHPSARKSKRRVLKVMSSRGGKPICQEPSNREISDTQGLQARSMRTEGFNLARAPTNSGAIHRGGHGV